MRVQGHSDLFLGCAVMGMVLMLIVPLSPLILDLLLILSFSLSLMTLLLTLFTEDHLEFSSFPSLLLFLTLFRLGLNITSTRMILSQAQAGDVIATFGKYVTEGSSLVGFLLFLLFTLMNFIVITKGAGRVAEVSARFYLEGVAGKQMGIDASLNHGLISHEEAIRSREKIGRESAFFGAMDGASQFVRGEAIFSLVITSINILGGTIAGIFLQKMHVNEAFHLFATLTIGDGLIAQIPSLLVSLATGIMVTKASHKKLSLNLKGELFGSPLPFLITSLFLLFLSLVPGMPYKITLPLSLFCFILFTGKKGAKMAPSVEIVGKIFPKKKMQILKDEVLKEIGFFPHVTESPSSDAGYVLRIHGEKIKEGVQEEELKELIITHAHQLLQRGQVHQMIENAKRVDHFLMEELQAKKIDVSKMMKILQLLLKERVSIQNFMLICETLALQTSSSVEDLTESVRKQLSQGLIERRGGALNAITFDHDVEEMITASFQEEGKRLFLKPKTLEAIEKMMDHWIEVAKKKKLRPVILTHLKSRKHIFYLLQKYHLPVLSYQEIGNETQVVSLGTITHDILLV